MKTVVSNSQVAHLWANQSQEHARSESMSFRGVNLYSYSTCIAALHHGGVALLNSRKYSSTTSSRHMPAVRNALRGLDRLVLSVPEVCGVIDYPQDMARAHSINQSYLSAEYKAYAAKLMRVLSLSDWQRTRLGELAIAAFDYARVFALTVPELRPEDDFGMAQGRQLRLAADPKRQARIAERERAAAAKAERIRLARELANVDNLAAFRAGAAQYGYQLVDRDGAAYLRVSADGETVQTSRGASVPTADAIRAIRFIRAVKYLRMRDWHRNGEQCPVGQFQVDTIAASGNIKAGCHFIKWAEIEAIGAALGVN